MKDVTFNEQLLYDNSQPDFINLLRKQANQILKIINISHINRTLQEKLNETSDKKDKNIDENRDNIGGS